MLDALLAKLLLRESASVGVESEQNLLVAERVLLLHHGALGASFTLGCSQDGLDFRRVDQTGQVCVGDRAGRQDEVLLEGRRSSGAAVDLIEGLESRRAPDDKATQVTTGSKLEEVERVHGRCLNAGDVTECTDELLAIRLRIVDNERAATLAETTVPQLTLTGAQLFGLLHLNELVTSTDGLEELDGTLGLGERTTLESLGLDNQRNLRYSSDTVTTGKEERGYGRGSQGGRGSEAPRIDNLLVPLKNARTCQKLAVKIE